MTRHTKSEYRLCSLTLLGLGKYRHWNEICWHVHRVIFRYPPRFSTKQLHSKLITKCRNYINWKEMKTTLDGHKKNTYMIKGGQKNLYDKSGMVKYFIYIIYIYPKYSFSVFFFSFNLNFFFFFIVFWWLMMLFGGGYGSISPSLLLSSLHFCFRFLLSFFHFVFVNYIFFLFDKQIL